MDVAILGASGDCGRAIAGQLIASRLLGPTERLQLVGRREGNSASVLHGLVSDLTDAYAEHSPVLDVALGPDEIVADLWVVASGASVPPRVQNAGGISRGGLAAANAPVFREYADALARHGQGTEVVVVVSNPVELGVAYFAAAAGRHRVIGIGAYSDTLRFRREIAADLGMKRHRISGFMLGEHGDGQAPIWSSVRVHGMGGGGELAQTVQRLRRGVTSETFAALCAEERHQMIDLLEAGRVADAFARVDTLPPDARVILKPYITHLSGSKTVLATASVTVDLISTLLDGREALVAGQMMLEGDFHGLSGPLGVPVIVGPEGISSVVEIPLSAEELFQIQTISRGINERVTAWMGERPA